MELAGLWGRSKEACAAGIGLRFTGDGVHAVNGDSKTLIFDSPKYLWAATAEGGALTIAYRLPRRPGGVSTAGGEGRAELVWRRETDRLSLARHSFRDVATGSVRASLADGEGALNRAFDLGRCGLRPAQEKGAPTSGAPKAADLRGLGG